MTIDGRVVAAEMNARTRERAAKLAHPPRVVALVVNETPATRSYLSIKQKQGAAAGCEFETERFPESVTAAELVLAASSDVDAVIVQLPLQASLDARAVCDAIPLERDADVLSHAARSLFEHGEEGALLPPVAVAVDEILRRGSVSVAGKRAVVIGSGFLVGAPVAQLLTQRGAQVNVVTRDSGDLAKALQGADIVVCGAGIPRLIIPDMLKDGVVLIDAGTSESGGTIVGDADPACADRCALFTPVPGGVGPIAVAALFENAVLLAERKRAIL